MILSTEMHGGILIVTLSGEVSFREVVSRWREVLDFAADTDAKTILINCRGMTGYLSSYDRYDIGFALVSHMESLQIKPWIALVGVPVALDGFGLRIALDRGVRGAIFDDAPAATECITKIEG